MAETHIGLQIPGFSYPGVPDDELFETVAGIARAGEDAGYDSVWLMDHFEQLPMLGGIDEPMLEGYTTLAALAARTERIRLGTLVTGVTYRNPALLAKIVTTLDVISKGRAMLGIGAAWFDREHEAYGWGPLPAAGERFERLEDALEICRAMFTDDQATYEGRHHSVHEARNLPKPVRPGGPPILIGGGGERKTLRLVARYADLCNFFGGVDDIRHKVEVLEKHCGEVGRDPNEITKTILTTVISGPDDARADERKRQFLEATGLTEEALGTFALFGGPDRITELMVERREAGIDGAIVNFGNEYATDLDTVAAVGGAVRAAFA